MAILQVVKYGHQSLRHVAKMCKPEEVEAQFIEDMIETMYALDGAGLAATQVDADMQLCVALEPDKNKVHVLLNPLIIARSEKISVDLEGCLSLPQLQGEVPRYEKIVVRAQTPEGESVEHTAKGLFARILQHEIDHLNGILYIDRIDLETLVWLRRKPGTEQIVKEPARLVSVQQEFRRIYHTNKELLFFDSPAKA
ncbi:peptide deformylase [candidate division KSB1 bacterium]|nr:peptide deformylase [candidate division KSB1 bacterium]